MGVSPEMIRYITTGVCPCCGEVLLSALIYFRTAKGLKEPPKHWLQKELMNPFLRRSPSWSHHRVSKILQ